MVLNVRIYADSKAQQPKVKFQIYWFMGTPTVVITETLAEIEPRVKSLWQTNIISDSS